MTIYKRDDTGQIESGYPDLIPLSQAVTILVWALKGPQEISWLTRLQACTTLCVYTVLRSSPVSMESDGCSLNTARAAANLEIFSHAGFKYQQ